MKTLQSFVQGDWLNPRAPSNAILSAISDTPIAHWGETVNDFAPLASFARNIGGPALRALSFHDRAKMLKGLGDAILARKEELYQLSFETGATRADGGIDIEGGAGVLLWYASKGKRELPNDTLWLDGSIESLSKRGSFVGQHVMTSMKGVAVHINAFNFPVWGMLEKLAPALLAGRPVIIKPATATAYVAEAAFRILIEANVLPLGAVQLVIGPIDKIFDHLAGQDCVAFTGSADTAQRIRSHPAFSREGVRFNSEQDSVNAAVLGPDANMTSQEFDIFIREVVSELTVKAGQKCTAIRRAFVPTARIDDVELALKKALAEITIGDPRQESTTMGPLVSQAQLRDVRAKITDLCREARVIIGDAKVQTPNLSPGAYMSPIILRCDTPDTAQTVHETEAFGPVMTLMPYETLEHAVALVNRGKGSLVMSLFTNDVSCARAIIHGSASFHGRLAVIDRDCAKESTGHGAPLPSLLHGGPGRAGGGEELGGLRSVLHYMQRTAVQASPNMLSATTNNWSSGAKEFPDGPHPFRLKFGELALGKTLVTKARMITLDDVEHFAKFTGDTFYAHMDEKAAAANPLFGGRVAHGYLILSFAAGLFVDPDPGPVLANFGLDNLRFLKPVKPGDTIKVKLTAKSKSLRTEKYGEVKWAVAVTNQNDEPVATYELLTMNAV